MWLAWYVLTVLAPLVMYNHDEPLCLSTLLFSLHFSLLLQCFNCSNPEFQKSMKEFSEKLGVVKEDLKVRYKLIKRLHFFHFKSYTYSTSLKPLYVISSIYFRGFFEHICPPYAELRKQPRQFPRVLKML